MNHRFGLPMDPYGLRNFVDFVFVIECTCSRTVHAERVTPFVICQALQSDWFRVSSWSTLMDTRFRIQVIWVVERAVCLLWLVCSPPSDEFITIWINLWRLIESRAVVSSLMSSISVWHAAFRQEIVGMTGFEWKYTNTSVAWDRRMPITYSGETWNLIRYHMLC